MSVDETVYETRVLLLEEALGYEFRDRSLLEQALTHRSFANEQERACQDNERLEYLGDSVLGMAVSHHLFQAFPEMSEGELSRARAHVVQTSTLARVGEQELALGGLMRLGRGEDATGGQRKRSILADGVEALVGAIFLDGGYAEAARVVIGLLEPCFRHQSQLVEPGPKSRLQEWLQNRGLPAPTYHLRQEAGPDHAKSFVLEARVLGVSLSKGCGNSKKEATTNAASTALARLVEGDRELLCALNLPETDDPTIASTDHQP